MRNQNAIDRQVTEGFRKFWANHDDMQHVRILPLTRDQILARKARIEAKRNRVGTRREWEADAINPRVNRCQ
jgi:hypothetical protein